MFVAAGMFESFCISTQHNNIQKALSLNTTSTQNVIQMLFKVIRCVVVEANHPKLNCLCVCLKVMFEITL